MAKIAEYKPSFKERQYPSIPSFLANLLLGPAVWLVFAPINQSTGLLTSVVLTGLSIALRLATSKRLLVNKVELQVGKARIPRSAVAGAISIAKEHQFDERGPRLDSRAFLALKGGLNGLVKVFIEDPRDPTPYLLISTRRPSELAESLRN